MALQMGGQSFAVEKWASIIAFAIQTAYDSKYMPRNTLSDSKTQHTTN